MSNHITNLPVRVKVSHKRITDNFFMLMGQSNAQGQGIIDGGIDVPKVGVYQVDEDINIVKGEDPLFNHGLEVQNTMSCGMQFARDFVDANPTKTISLALCAQSGTAIGGLGGWHAGGPIYLKAVAIANKMINMGQNFSGILWLQGTSDSQASISADYADNLLDMITRFRSDTNSPNVPFLVASLTDTFVNADSVPFPQASREEVNNALLDAPNQIDNCAGADLGDLTLQDLYHLNASSLRTAGSRLFTAYQTL